MSALADRRTYPFYPRFVYSEKETSVSFFSLTRKLLLYSRKILPTDIGHSTNDRYNVNSIIHTNGRIPRRRTNWQTLTDGGSVKCSKWPLLTGGPVLGRHVRHFPQKPRYFHSICPLRPARIGSLRTHTSSALIAIEEISLCLLYCGRSNDYSSSRVLN